MTTHIAIALLSMFAATGALGAQGPVVTPTPAEMNDAPMVVPNPAGGAAAPRTITPLSVQVTLSTCQDGKRLTSRPYTLSVDTGEVPARITMSTPVP